MLHPHARARHPWRSSLVLVLALLSLLLETINFQVEHGLAPEPLSGSLEVFTAAAHPFAPLHLDRAGIATYRNASPALLHLIKSIGTKTLPVVAMLRPDPHGVLVIAETPQLFPGTRSCCGYRGPPVRFV